MKFRKEFGILLIFVGICIIIIQPFSMTGAVIDITTAVSRVWAFIGLAMILGGAGLLISRNTGGLETIIGDVASNMVSTSEMIKRINQIEPDDKKRALVLDTSAIITYENGIKDILDNYKDVIAPDEVLDEIHNKYLFNLIEDNTVSVDDYEKYQDMARDYLAKTDKPRIREELLPYLSGGKTIESGSEQVRINKMTKNIRGIMGKEGYDLELAKATPDTVLELVKEYLDKHCQVSDADVDVLAMAINRAKNGHHAIVMEKDVDFNQAIDLIKKEDPKLGKNIDYVEPYL